MGFIDLHSHILPGVDDGAQSLEETRAMLEQALTTGTTEMVATPHMFRPGLGLDDTGRAVAAFDRLIGDLGADHAPRLHLGAENYLSSELLEAAAAREVLTLGGSRYLLIELWPMTLASTARNALGNLADAGYVPVLAHVERYGFLHEDPGALEGLVEAGYVAQVNAGAVLGRDGLALARLADRWLRRGWIAIVASDAHGVTRRRPELGAVASHLAARYGQATADLCLSQNPAALLADRHPALPPVTPRRRWWQFRSD